MRGRRTLITAAVAGVCGCALIASALAAPSANFDLQRRATGGGLRGALVRALQAGERDCLPGKGKPTPGGGNTGKVSHRGWPYNDGLYWKVFSNGRGKHHFQGGSKNDELLGHHSDDTIRGGGGKDIIWGDWDAHNNNTSQRDNLSGGAAGDFMYASHGTNTIDSGGGNDHVYAYYGHGSINCGGGGKDVAWVRKNGAYHTRSCEIIKHFETLAGPERVVRSRASGLWTAWLLRRPAGRIARSSRACPSA